MIFPFINFLLNSLIRLRMFLVKHTLWRSLCDAVPVQSYENLREYIEKQEEEKKPYLTAEQPVMYAQTSGTTGDPKFISILKSSISQYRKSQQVFAYAVYASISGVYNGKVLGIRSPAVGG